MNLLCIWLSNDFLNGGGDKWGLKAYQNNYPEANIKKLLLKMNRQLKDREINGYYITYTIFDPTREAVPETKVFYREGVITKPLVLNRD